MPEPWLLWAGTACYGLAVLLGLIPCGKQQVLARAVLPSLSLGVLFLGIVLGLRWFHLGQGPFMTMYEALLSNAFSLGLIFVLACLVNPLVQYGKLVVSSILCLLVTWTNLMPVAPVILPPTFDNYILWFHVLAGKLFLGTCLLAVGLSSLLLWHYRHAGHGLHDNEVQRIDATIWRYMALAFVFHSIMLIAGAVWAQDAWGRYWGWDPLETWSLVTWLVLGMVLHLRLTYTLPPWSGWLLVIVVFVLAFLTFFGVPFLSLAPHQGIM